MASRAPAAHQHDGGADDVDDLGPRRAGCRCRCRGRGARPPATPAQERRWIACQVPVAEPAAQQAGDDDGEQQVARRLRRGRARSGGRPTMNGTTASSQPIGAKPSITVIAMWSAEEARPRAATRCGARPGVTKRGHAGVLHRAVVSTPRATLAGEQDQGDDPGRADDVPAELGRGDDHRSTSRRSPAAARRRASRRRSRRRRRRRARVGPAGASLRQPARRSGAEDDRRRRRHVGVDARRARPR